MPYTNFSKFIRPEQARRGQITDRDLDILEAVLRYRFSPTSQLIRLVGGNEDVTHRRLRCLWEWDLLNRWAFPGIRAHSEFYYYLDNRAALDVLAERRGLEIHEQMLDELRNNRDKDYSGAVMRGQHMQLGFLQHSLMVSRMHFCLELGGRKSGGKIHLDYWTQGAQLAGRKVELPKVAASRSGREYFWEEADTTERLPVEPDALFTLRLTDQSPDVRLAHFFYEADRGTMTMTDMLKKMRSYYHFIKKQQKHKDAFGRHPIRAVLIETTNEARAKRLMQLTNHALVCGPNKRSGLFWFTISSLFTEPEQPSSPAPYLQKPELIFQPIWALPDRTFHALSDLENSPTGPPVAS